MNSEISIKRILFLAANPKGTTQLLIAAFCLNLISHQSNGRGKF
ncbi:MAG: hypothetical protein RM347_006885 [Nostoc sp. ChiQUE02]|nr:hypothetical protein [Nostoc sp. ChiQUE02]